MTRYFPKFGKRLLLAISIGASMQSHAKVSMLDTWTPNIPSAIAPFQNNATQLANLTEQHIFLYAHPSSSTSLPTFKANPKPKVQFQSAALVLPVSAETIKTLLTNHKAYVGLYPNITKAELIEQKAHKSIVQYQVHIPTPIPILNFKQDVTFQHQINGNSIDSIVLDAPIPYAVGKMEWFELAPDKTLVTITQWGDLNRPQGFLMKKVLQALPEAKAGIPAGTNTYLLEALRERFIGKKTIALGAGQWPKIQLSPDEKKFLAQHIQRTGQPVSFVHVPTTVPYQHGPEALRFTTTLQHYNQPAKALEPLTQPKIYQSLFPKQVKDLRLNTIAEQKVEAYYKIGASLGVITIPFHVYLGYDVLSPTQSEYRATKGDVKYIKGRIQIDGAEQGSLLQMTTAAKIDAQAPFLLRAARSLPYHDVIPVVSSNTIFAVKSKEKLN